jgi:hypothetical protein
MSEEPARTEAPSPARAWEAASGPVLGASESEIFRGPNLIRNCANSR